MLELLPLFEWLKHYTWDITSLSDLKMFLSKSCNHPYADCCQFVLNDRFGVILCRCCCVTSICLHRPGQIFIDWPYWYIGSELLGWKRWSLYWWNQVTNFSYSLILYISLFIWLKIRLNIRTLQLKSPVSPCSVEQLKDLGCKWVILGHSERRHVIGEKDEVSLLKKYLIRSSELLSKVCEDMFALFSTQSYSLLGRKLLTHWVRVLEL